MKIKQLGAAIVVLFTLVSLKQGQHYISASSDSPYGVYPGDASWEVEWVFLHDFANYLKQHPEMTGHIVYFSSKEVSRRKLEKRLRRSERYLTRDEKIPRSRLKIYYGGHTEASKIVLQPLEEPKTD